jgi:uncharacterized protein YqgV (UPF0045/DUF77 family)
MYPFQQDYKVPIQNFIDKLNTYKGLRINTTPTATMVTGEYESVMLMLTEMLLWSYQTHGKAVYVTKFIPDYDPQ